MFLQGFLGCLVEDFFIVYFVNMPMSRWPSELEGRQFDSRHSIDVCFDFPLFRVAVALNTRKTEH